MNEVYFKPRFQRSSQRTQRVLQSFQHDTDFATFHTPRRLKGGRQPTDRSFQSIFGHTIDYSKPVQSPSRQCFTPTKSLNFNAKQLKQKSLNMYWPQAHPLQENCKVQTIEVQGLNPSATSEDLKKIIGSAHIVSADTQVNHLNGLCTGKATIKVRTTKKEEVEPLRSRLVQKGLRLSNVTPIRGRNSCFTTPRRNFLEVTDQKQKVFQGCSNSLEKHLKTFRSTDDLFGSSRGVGRGTIKRLETSPGKDVSLGVIAQWEMTRKVSVSRMNKPRMLSEIPRYMQATISSSSKLKQQIVKEKVFVFDWGGLCGADV